MNKYQKRKLELYEELLEVNKKCMELNKQNLEINQQHLELNQGKHNQYLQNQNKELQQKVSLLNKMNEDLYEKYCKEIKKHSPIDKLRQYVQEDNIYNEYKSNPKFKNTMSDFEEYCVNHCKDVEYMLNSYDKLLEENERLMKLNGTKE